MARVDPAPAAKATARAESGRRPAVGRHHAHLSGHVLADRVDDLRAGVLGRLLVANRAWRVVEHNQPAVGRPAQTADHVVVGADHDRLASVGERSDDQFASAHYATAAAAARRGRRDVGGARRRPHERDVRSIGRQRDVRFRLRRGPDRSRLAAAERDLPQIALPRVIHPLAVGAPEKSGALTIGVARQRARGGRRRRRSYDVDDKNIGDAGPLRQKCHVPPIRRPHRVRGMTDVDDLFDREPAAGAGGGRLRRRLDDEHEGAQRESECDGGQ